jgi:tRNA-specific 2-thiouridylase
MARNTLYVVEGHDHPWLLAQTLIADQLSWVSGVAPLAGQYAAKTRYRQHDALCELVDRPQGNDEFGLKFAQPQWAVTPGQSAVLYDGDICLGGGMIA